MRGTMNAEQKRIAIAEACGWVFDHIRNGAMYYVPTLEIHVGNPLTDLNAMNEAENTLSDADYGAFQGHLLEIIKPGTHWSDMANTRIASATAAQRADAFLITLGILKP